MSFSRVKMQSNREYDRQIYAAVNENKSMGALRVVSSALVILFSVFMYYIAMHYIPALANPRKVIRLATETETLPPASTEFDFEEVSPLEKLMGRYYRPFVMDRAYMRAGESIKIKYEIPEGSSVQLDIVQCRRIWAIEIFHCDVVSQFSAKKEARRGIATYALGDAGFYHFRHKVEGLEATDSYRLVWERIDLATDQVEKVVNRPITPI